MPVRLIDGPTAAALAQILPVLLLPLHGGGAPYRGARRAGSEQRARVLLAVFFGSFAVVETLLVVSIDGLPAGGLVDGRGASPHEGAQLAGTDAAGTDAADVVAGAVRAGMRPPVPHRPLRCRHD